MIAIIDYKAGNLTSVRLAFESLGIPAHVTANHSEILASERVVFPGVGAAGAAMQTLHAEGLVDIIRQVAGRGTPFLGICLGTQIIFERSDEDGGVDCIGLIQGTVKRFTPASSLDKVPQMGWNSVRQIAPHHIFEGLQDDSEFYFVHSYYPAPTAPNCIVGVTSYAGVDFASAVGRDNVVATQFHPEKSGKPGLQLLRNFAAWKPR